MSGSRIWALAAACSLVGCKSWQSMPVGQLGPSDSAVVLVTNDHAYEFEITQVDATSVQGHARQTWNCMTCDVEVDGEAEGPGELEKRLGWQRIQDPNGPARELRRDQIRAASQYGFDGGATLFRVGVLLAVTAVIVVGSLTLSGHEMGSNPI